MARHIYTYLSNDPTDEQKEKKKRTLYGDITQIIPHNTTTLSEVFVHDLKKKKPILEMSRSD